MFILSKRNFKVRRADGSSFLIKKDFIGDIPEDVFNSRLIQKAIKGGLVAAPESHKDKALYISIHTSLAGGDDGIGSIPILFNDFNPHLPRGR